MKQFKDIFKREYYSQVLSQLFDNIPADDIEHIVNTLMSGMGVFVEMKATDNEKPDYIDYHVFVSENEGTMLFGFNSDYERILKIYNEL